MNKYIGYCGLDCESCEARIATVNGDEALRRKVAAEWSKLNHAEITPEMIRCNGCRTDGVKSLYCDSICGIRKCAVQKGCDTCAACTEMEECAKLGMILANNAEAKARLLENRKG